MARPAPAAVGCRGGATAMPAAAAHRSPAMSYDPRTIAFVAEILFPPVQLRAEQVQGVHNTLFRQPALGYQSFQVAPDGIHLSNLPQTPGQVSMASFLPDRLVLREELRGTTIEDFATRVVNVAQVAFQALSVPLSLARQLCVRSLINPRQRRDGRELLVGRLLVDGEARLQALQRPTQALGLRLLLPPAGGGRDTHQVRIETWPHDPRSLWLEDTATWQGPVTGAELPKLADELYATYRFLTGPVADFIASYDPS